MCTYCVWADSSYTSYFILCHQVRNQKFFRAGEILWNLGTSINISYKAQEKKGNFFLLDTLKTTFWMENLTQRWIQSGTFFTKSGHFFLFSKKGRGGLQWMSAAQQSWQVNWNHLKHHFCQLMILGFRG